MNEFTVMFALLAAANLYVAVQHISNSEVSTRKFERRIDIVMGYVSIISAVACMIGILNELL